MCKSRPENIPAPPRHRQPPRRPHHLHRRLALVRPRNRQVDRPAGRRVERPGRHRHGARRLRRLGTRHRQQPVVRPQPGLAGAVVARDGLAGRAGGRRDSGEGDGDEEGTGDDGGSVYGTARGEEQAE